MRNILIVGTGGHAKVVLEIVEAQFKNAEIAFIDDHNKNESFLDYPILGTTSDLKVILTSCDLETGIIIAIGDSTVRKNIVSKFDSIMEDCSAKYIAAIHPTASVSKRAMIMPGTVVMPNVTVNSHVLVGRHVILNNNCSIDHDCTIMDFVHIDRGVHLGGNVTVKDGIHVGMGRAIKSGTIVKEVHLHVH